MGRQTKSSAKGGDAKNTPCRYFARGKCRDGDKCKFSHDISVGEGGGGGGSSVKKNSLVDAKKGPGDDPSDQSPGKEVSRKKTPIPKKKHRCRSCKETSTKLVALRSQTEAGLQLIDRMELAFGELAKLARSNLEQTMSELSHISSQTQGSSPRSENMAQDDTGVDVLQEKDDSAKIAPTKDAANTARPPCEKDGKPQRSATVGIADERNAESVTKPSDGKGSDFGGDTVSGASSSPPKASLVGIIASYAPFMTGSPQGYMDSLYNEFGVKSFAASDMVEIFADCLDVLSSVAAGTASEEDVRLLDAVLGGIAVGVQKDFCEDMMSAAKGGHKSVMSSSSSPATAGEDLSTTAEGHTIAIAAKMADEAESASSKGVVGGRGSPICVASDVTKAAGGSSKAAPSCIEHKEEQPEKSTAQEEAPAEPATKERAKPLLSLAGRKRAPQVAAIGKKLSALPRKEYSLTSSRKKAPLPKVEAEHVEKDNGGAKALKAKNDTLLEIEEPMKRMTEGAAEEDRRVQDAQREEQRQKSAVAWKMQQQNAYMNSFVSDAESLLIRSSLKRDARPETFAKVLSIEGHQLPSYIKPIPQLEDASVAPIFRLLRNEDTVPNARELLRLERKAQKQLDIVAGLELKKAVEEKALNKIISDSETFTAEWTGYDGEANRLKEKMERVKRRAQGSEYQLTVKDRALDLTEKLFEQTPIGQERKQARDLRASVKNKRLGIGEAFDKKREAREREIREKESELAMLQQEIEAGDRADAYADEWQELKPLFTDADEEDERPWRKKRRELKKLEEQKRKQLEAAIKFSDAIEIKTHARRWQAEKNEAEKQENAKETFARVQDRLIEGEEQLKEWPKMIGTQRREVDKFDSRVAAAMRHVNETQAKILAITGANQNVKFDIEMKDERGHTILMHTAQTNDPATASICLQMGADVHAVNLEGLTAIDYSFFFQFEAVTRLILERGGSLPSSQVEAWSFLPQISPMKSEASHSWEETLKTAAIAAVPSEQYLESPESCEMDEAKRMETLSDDDIASMDFSCFEARLVEPKINADQVHRVVLLDEAVHNRLRTDSADAAAFVGVVEGLMPSEIGRSGVSPTKCHRRGIVGTTDTFEVLAARLSSKSDEIVLFSPFIGGEADGVSNVGMVVWAICNDQEASLFKTLLSNTEFLRSKSEMNDRFLPHNELCLELGADMHLLSLRSTSIWNAATMQLFLLNVDQGDLRRVTDPDFSAEKRIAHSEELVNRALFSTSDDEMKKNDGILAAERTDMSSLIRGGAGVGKTLLMIRKVCHVSEEDPSRRILVVSRLPRLINVIKVAVEEKRSDSAQNVKFFTYDELMQLLAKRVSPDDESQWRSFVGFDQVHFDCDEDVGASFCRSFVGEYLNQREKNVMNESNLEALTLWQAITAIKSHAECAATKKPLSLDAYIALPSRFGLTTPQRELCYELFEKYERWKEVGASWDEADRALYVLEHGPSVYRDNVFIPWRDRVNRRGEIDLLDDEGGPRAPFCFDMVFADEAQDFTALDQALLLRMSDTRSVFYNIDPAQSVEEGVKINAKVVNEVFFSHCERGTRVNDVLQIISLKTNHRTHEENLRLATAVRRLLARSFKIPLFEERALIRGKIPKTLRVSKIDELTKVFRGANCVFIAPDEKVPELRVRFRELGIENDLFGVREAKGLEFDSVALIGFFAYIEERGSGDAWKNALRWLSSSAGITETTSSGEKICGTILEDCDYRLTHPEVSDEAMLLYTALTRARNQLYLIEADCANDSSRKSRGVKMADYAFWRLNELALAQSVENIDEGQEEMTPAQYKARGVLKVVQALSMIQQREPFDLVRTLFVDATDCFGPSKGNDRPLLVQSRRHLQALEAKRELHRYAKENFHSAGEYHLDGRFAEVLRFEAMASSFFSSYLGDSYLVEEVREVRRLVENVFIESPYEFRFREVCQTINELGRFV